jgi:UDP-sugar transporter A1/2/3
MTIFIVTTRLLIASNSMKSYNKDNNNVIDINNNNSSSNLQYKTIIFSLLLAIQYGIQPLLASRFTSKKISKTSVVITTEFCKILIALICVLTGIIKDFKINNFDIINSLKIAAIPAFLYAIQNIFVQYGYVLLDSMTFNVLNQTKTLSSAIFLFIVLSHYVR